VFCLLNTYYTCIALFMHRSIEGLRSRLKKNPRISGLRLSIAEKFLPADYYVQLRPPYATHTWEVDRRHYDEQHDWDNFRDGNRVLQAHVILDRVKRCASGEQWYGSFQVVWLAKRKGQDVRSGSV